MLRALLAAAARAPTRPDRAGRVVDRLCRARHGAAAWGGQAWAGAAGGDGAATLASLVRVDVWVLPSDGRAAWGGSMLAQRPRAARPVTALRLAHSRNARAPAPGTGPHTPPPPHRAPRQGLRRSDPARAWAKGV